MSRGLGDVYKRQPIKLSFILFFEMAHFKFASTGLVFSFMSWPYKHKPASNLKVSLAPNPIKVDPLEINSSTKEIATLLGNDISNPSSPVYPDLVI